MWNMDQGILMKLFTIGLFLLSSFVIFETVLAQGNYDVRLVGGSTFAEGRVEIYYSSEWGTVCDDGWGVEESQVVCRQLGYGGSSEVLGQGDFPSGTGTIWLDDVTCQGSESSLGLCSYRGWGSNDCSHFEDVGVRCYTVTDDEGALRLAGEGRDANEGRIEIYHSGQWGTVCDDGWDLYDGGVACRQLGYAGVDMVFQNAHFGEGFGIIWLDDMQCSGSELTLATCPNNGGWGYHNCDHAEDAGVRCSLHSYEGSVRLVNGPRASEGRLEIYHNDQWGTVCDDYWGTEDSQVVCRQLGYEGLDRYFRAVADESYEEAIGPIWLDNVRCYGYEDRLEYCSNTGWGVHDCTHFEDVGVKCLDDSGGSGLSAFAIAGIVVGSLVAICLFYVCCIKDSSKSPSQESAVDPQGGETREGTLGMGMVSSMEGTLEFDHAHPTGPDSNAVPDLPPPSYDEIGKYTAFSGPGSEGVYPPPPPTAPYPPPTTPYPPPTAPYPPLTTTYSTPTMPYPPPSAHYVEPSFPGATVTYLYPAGDSGTVPIAPPVPPLPPSN